MTNSNTRSDSRKAYTDRLSGMVEVAQLGVACVQCRWCLKRLHFLVGNHTQGEIGGQNFEPKKKGNTGRER